MRTIDVQPTGKITVKLDVLDEVVEESGNVTGSGQRGRPEDNGRLGGLEMGTGKGVLIGSHGLPTQPTVV